MIIHAMIRIAMISNIFPSFLKIVPCHRQGTSSNLDRLRSAERGTQQDAAGTNRRATPSVSPKAVVMTRNVRNGLVTFADHTHGSKVAARGCFGIQAAHGSAHSASRRGSAQARRSRMVTCTCEGPSDLMLPPPTRDPCA